MRQEWGWADVEGNRAGAQRAEHQGSVGWGTGLGGLSTDNQVASEKGSRAYVPESKQVIGDSCYWWGNQTLLPLSTTERNLNNSLVDWVIRTVALSEQEINKNVNKSHQSHYASDCHVYERQTLNYITPSLPGTFQLSVEEHLTIYKLGSVL